MFCTWILQKIVAIQKKRKKKGVEKQQLWSIFASFASNEAEKTRVRKWKVKKRTKKTRSLKEKDTKTRSQ